MYPPERLPPQPQGRGTPPGVPAAAPSLRAGPAAADPRAGVPEDFPFALTDPGSASTDTATPSVPALTSRPKPKSTAPEAAPDAAALPAQIPLLLLNTAPAPATGTAPTQAAAPSSARAAGAAAVAPGPFPAEPQANLPTSAGARGAFQATVSGKQTLPDTDPEGHGVTDPFTAPLPAAAGAIPVKVTAAPVPPANGGSSAASVDTQSSGTDGLTPDPGLLSIDFNPTHAPAESPAAAPQVQSPVGANGWTEEVGAHVIFMAHQGVSAASLRLQPEHLGPLQVKISVHDSTASVWFGANEPETRTALQAALPQLKEMFAAQGMTLADASVSREPPREAPTPRAAGNNSNPAAATVLDSPVAASHTRRGLVDTYA